MSKTPDPMTDTPRDPRPELPEAGWALDFTGICEDQPWARPTYFLPERTSPVIRFPAPEARDSALAALQQAGALPPSGGRDMLEWASEMGCEMEADDLDDYDPKVCSPDHTGRCWPCEARVRLAAELAASPVPPSVGDVPAAGSPDDIRAAGWSVAVHNDYRLGGVASTFWLFTYCGQAVKGEGRTDEEALNEVRRQLALLAKPAAQACADTEAQVLAEVADALEAEGDSIEEHGTSKGPAAICWTWAKKLRSGDWRKP